MAEHRIFPHGALEEVAPSLWQVKGSLSIPLERNMTVHRLANGELVVYSAVAMNDEGMAALEALGRPAWLIVPHPLHTMDARFYKERYPAMRVIAPDDARAKLGGLKVDFDPARGLGELGLRHHVPPGMRYTELVLDLDVDAGRVLVFTDMMTRGDAPTFFERLFGPPGEMGVPRIVKFRQVKSKPAVRRFFEELASEGDAIGTILCSHGPPISAQCARGLRTAAANV